MTDQAAALDPKVAHIFVYPVKSLDGQTLGEARVLPSGALQHDRAFALFDGDGRVVNAKRFPALQRVRARHDLAAAVVHVRTESDGQDRPFDLRSEGDAFARWIEPMLGMAVHVREDRATGFPDDLASPGPTVISTATLAAIAAWFGLPLGEIRARLRANIEIGGVPAFWEDRLFAAEGVDVPFRIGRTFWRGVNPCLRCAVPTRDSHLGTPDPGFVAQFAALRARDLPPWARRERFKPFYRVAVNTRGATGPAADGDPVVRVGDAVVIG